MDSLLEVEAEVDSLQEVVQEEVSQIEVAEVVVLEARLAVDMAIEGATMPVHLM